MGEGLGARRNGHLPICKSASRQDNKDA